MSIAAERWTEQLAGWGIPQPILDQAPTSPWAHDTATFQVDDTVPRDSTSARAAREVLPPTGATVLDVGCGGGRASIALVPPATELIGVDQDPEMLAEFRRAAEAAGVARRTVEGAWPAVADRTPLADVVVCHHVVFNVGDLVPFVAALTDHARLAVVVELPVRHPLSGWNAAWKHFWDLDRPTGPTHLDFVAVLREMGLDPEVTVGPRPAVNRHASDPAALLPSAMRRLCLHDDRRSEVERWLAEHEIDWVTEVATVRWPGTAELA